MTESKQGDRPTVVVVGGGYGGIGVAKALDETSEVVLVELPGQDEIVGIPDTPRLSRRKRGHRDDYPGH